MKENLLPEQKEIAKKSAMAVYLEKFLIAADSEIESVRYHEKLDAFYFKNKFGHSFTVNVSKKRKKAVLYEILRELKKWIKPALENESFLDRREKLFKEVEQELFEHRIWKELEQNRWDNPFDSTNARQKSMASLNGSNPTEPSYPAL